MERDIKRKWLPESKNAKIALRFCAAAVVWGILMPFIPFPQFAIGGLRGLFSGLVVISIEVILIITAWFFSYKAIFKEKEGSVITLLIFGLFCLVGGFWLLFALGEILVPH